MYEGSLVPGGRVYEGPCGTYRWFEGAILGALGVPRVPIWGPWEPIREAILPVDRVGAPIGEASVRLIGRARATRGVVASMKGAMAPMREAPGACAGWCLCGGVWSLDPAYLLGRGPVG